MAFVPLQLSICRGDKYMTLENQTHGLGRVANNDLFSNIPTKL